MTKLPTEVHEAILDHIFGYRVSATSCSNMRTSSAARSLGTAMRHSRRKVYTRLALVSPLWRDLIQQRLYRHVKLKATVAELEDAMVHFLISPHLRSYVRHIEIWFPVFKPAYGQILQSRSLPLPMVTQDGGLTNATYVLPEDNCTLRDAFMFVADVLPEAVVLTLEGGDRRKSPQVAYFRPDEANLGLPQASNIRTLITRGQWNLIRHETDYAALMSALPSITEWQGSFSKPKSKAYISTSIYLSQLPPTLTHLNLCLESDYRREPHMPSFYYKALQSSHICTTLATTLPVLETFSYTGRVCHSFFDTAARRVVTQATRLTSVDLTVKNCCRHLSMFHESGSGVQDMPFIDAFETLVLSAVRSLEKFPNLEYLRIRFVDLGSLPFPLDLKIVAINKSLAESVLPALNPYFILRRGQCTGVWSDRIIKAMSRVRPGVKFPELSESFGDIFYNRDGRMVVAPENPQPRVTSLKLSNYQSLTSGRITIQ